MAGEVNAPHRLQWWKKWLQW